MFGKFKKQQKAETPEGEKVAKRLSKGQIKQKNDYLKQVMNQYRLPILVVDPQWYTIKPLVQNDVLLKKEKCLLEYVKEQGTLTNQLKEDQLVKQNLMKDVLTASQTLNEYGDESKLHELETLQQGIIKISEAIKKYEGRLETLEELIEQENREIIQEIVSIGYEQMESYKAESQEIQAEIDQLRELMLQKNAEKKKLDEANVALYQYLHNVVGYKHLDKVDKVLGEK